MESKADEDTLQILLSGYIVTYDQGHGCMADHGQNPLVTCQAEDVSRCGEEGVF